MITAQCSISLTLPCSKSLAQQTGRSWHCRWQKSTEGEAGLCFCALEQCRTLEELQHSQQSFATFPASSSPPQSHTCSNTHSHHHNAPQIMTSREVVHFFLFNIINRIKLPFMHFFHCCRNKRNFSIFFKAETPSHSLDAQKASRRHLP